MSVLSMYLMSPPEEAGCVDVGVDVIFIVGHLDVVPHTVVYSGHDACYTISVSVKEHYTRLSS